MSTIFSEFNEQSHDFKFDAALDIDSALTPATVPQAQVASLEAQLIVHCLNILVPSMLSGFKIITTQGLLCVDGEVSQEMAELMHKHLMKRLETA
ncbi:hypothetical protein [uncultured Comamonas sp.]|uniref:hypothetical protein n=1 Tax=uncultured Comamonas sp. TaxID=114710 RepID=UPI0025DF73CA|nr:hypothetical protein [uncultured Comamonas sp.]